MYRSDHQETFPNDKEGGPSLQYTDSNRLGPPSLSFTTHSSATTFHSYVSDPSPSAPFYPSSSSLHNALNLTTVIPTIEIPPLISIPAGMLVVKIQDLPPVAKICFYRAQGIFIGNVLSHFLFFKKSIDVEGHAAMAWKEVVKTRATETDAEGQLLPGVEQGYGSDNSSVHKLLARRLYKVRKGYYQRAFTHLEPCPLAKNLQESLVPASHAHKNKGYRLLDERVWPGEQMARPPQTHTEVDACVQYWLSGGRFKHSGSIDPSTNTPKLDYLHPVIQALIFHIFFANISNVFVLGPMIKNYYELFPCQDGRIMFVDYLPEPVILIAADMAGMSLRRRENGRWSPHPKFDSCIKDIRDEYLSLNREQRRDVQESWNLLVKERFSKGFPPEVWW